MIYEWRCTGCKELVEVERPAADYMKPPEIMQSKDCIRHNWTKVITQPTAVPFQTLKNAGIFPNQYGDIPPRKMD